MPSVWKMLSVSTQMLFFPTGKNWKLPQWSASKPPIVLSPVDQLIVFGHNLLEAHRPIPKDFSTSPS